MSIKKLFLAAVLTLTAFAASAESLTNTVMLTPNPTFPGWYSSSFGVTHQFAGTFTDTFSFLPELSGDVTSSIITIEFLPNSDIDFTSVSINGTFFNLTSQGTLDIASLQFASLRAPLLLTVSGIAGDGLPNNAPIAASYSATLNLANAYQEVPEPATLGLLGLALLGFGALRIRKQ